MKTRKIVATTTLAVALSAFCASCDDAPTDNGGDAAQAAMAILNMSFTQRPATLHGAEPYVQACPSGGQFVVQGQQSIASEGSVTVSRWDETMRYQDCAMSYHSADAVATGEMHLVGEARFGPPVDGVLPMLSQESSQVGTMTTTFGGASTTCDYDLTHTFDADAGNYHISGTACGRSVDVRAPAKM